MKQPTAELHGSSLGDALGICWFCATWPASAPSGTAGIGLLPGDGSAYIMTQGGVL